MDRFEVGPVSMNPGCVFPGERVTLTDNDDTIVHFRNTSVKDNLRKRDSSSKCVSDHVFHSDFCLVDRPREPFRTICGNCRFVCRETMEQRRDNDEILTSNRVVEGPGFSFKVY
jgi:hypothetical protein